jgi:hypothetical protein
VFFSSSLALRVLRLLLFFLSRLFLPHPALPAQLSSSDASASCLVLWCLRQLQLRASGRCLHVPGVVCDGPDVIPSGNHARCRRGMVREAITALTTGQSSRGTGTHTDCSVFASCTTLFAQLQGRSRERKTMNGNQPMAVMLAVGKGYGLRRIPFRLGVCRAVASRLVGLIVWKSFRRAPTRSPHELSQCVPRYAACRHKT